MERRVKLGDIEFTVVEDEKPRDMVTITDNAVEKGQDVSDHVKQESSIIDIVGVMIGDDAATKLSALRKYQKEGKLLTYIGRNIYDNMAIQTIDRSHGKQISNGFAYNITLKQVRIAAAKEVEIKVADPVTKAASPKVKTKVKPKTNNGKQQPKTKSTTPPSPIRSEARVTSIAKDYVTPGGTMKAITSLYTKPPKKGLYVGGLF